MKAIIVFFSGAAMAVAEAQASPQPPQPVADPFASEVSPAIPAQSSEPVSDPFGGGSHAGAAIDPFGSGKPPVIISNIELGQTRVDALLDFVKQNLREQGKVPPNYVFKDGAEKEVVPSLRLRNVSLRGLHGVLEEVAELDIESLGNPGGEEIIVIRGPDRHLRGRAVQGVRVGSGMPPASVSVRRNPTAAAEYGRTHSANAPVTKVFATSDLGVDEEDLMSAIRAVWDTSDPEWAKGEFAAKLLYHPGTRMLVVKASPDRLGDVQQIMEQLNQVKERAQKGEVMEMKRRLHDVERSAERSLRQMEEDHHRIVSEMEKDRSRMMEKISVLELALRKAELQRLRSSEAEKSRDGGH